MIDFRARRGQALADDPFFAPLKTYPWPFQPTLLAQAVPGDPVERATYDQLKAEFLDRLKGMLPLDGVYLAMHGATSRRRPFHLVTDFTTLGLDPARFKIVVVKAGYLVPEIAAIANPNLMALTGGSVNQGIEHLESKRRVPTWPFQPNLQWKPSLVVSARS